MQREIFKNSTDKLKWNNKKFKQLRRRQEKGERKKIVRPREQTNKDKS